jgi:hypothetical protein
MINDQQLLTDLLIEMGNRVGIKWRNWDAILEYQKEDDVAWYTRKTWTQEESDDFKRWAQAYIRKHTKWSTRKIEWEVATFMLCYSWKIEEEA